MSLELRGFKELVGWLRGGTQKNLQDEMRARMRRAVLAVRKASIEYIKSETHGFPNAALTVLIKGSSKPLKDHGDLIAAITTAVEVTKNRIVGACGLMRTGARVRRGGGRARGLVNIGIALHEGFVVKVTPAVRAAVFAELRRRQGNKAAKQIPSGQAEQTWRVRGRPFIRVPLEQSAAAIAAELGEGVVTAFRK